MHHAPLLTLRLHCSGWASSSLSLSLSLRLSLSLSLALSHSLSFSFLFLSGSHRWGVSQEKTGSSHVCKYARTSDRYHCFLQEIDIDSQINRYIVHRLIRYCLKWRPALRFWKPSSFLPASHFVLWCLFSSIFGLLKACFVTLLEREVTKKI